MGGGGGGFGLDAEIEPDARAKGSPRSAARGVAFGLAGEPPTAQRDTAFGRPDRGLDRGLDEGLDRGLDRMGLASQGLGGRFGLGLEADVGAADGRQAGKGGFGLGAELGPEDGTRASRGEGFGLESEIDPKAGFQNRPGPRGQPGHGLLAEVAAAEGADLDRRGGDSARRSRPAGFGLAAEVDQENEFGGGRFRENEVLAVKSWE